MESAQKYSSRSLTSNIGAILIGSLAQKLLALYTLREIARYLSPEQYGVWSEVFVVAGFFGTMADFSLDVVVARELARSDSGRSQLFGNAILLKVMLAILSALLLITASFLLPYPSAVRRLIMLSSLSCWGSVASLLSVACQVEMKSHLAQVYSLAATISVLSGLLILIHLKASIGQLVLAQCCLGLSFQLVLGRQVFRFLIPDFHFYKPYQRLLIRSALPIAASAFAAQLYNRFDVFYLGMVRGLTEVGYYGAAYRLTESFSFIPGAIMLTVYPALASSVWFDREHFHRIIYRSTQALLILAVPLLLIFTGCAGPMLIFFFGPSYAPATPALVWLAVAEFTMFFTPLAFQILLVYDRERWVAGISAVLVAFNVTANWFLIPRFGFTAAAAITAGTQTIALGLAVIGFPSKNYLMRAAPRLLKIPLAGLIAGSVFWILPSLHLGAKVGLAIGFYICGLALSGVLREVIKPERLMKIGSTTRSCDQLNRSLRPIEIEDFTEMACPINDR